MNPNTTGEVKTSTPVVQANLDDETLWQLGDDCQTDEFADLTALLEE